jgi:hypothetical protein
MNSPCGVIYLDGTNGAGKSSLAKAIQKRVPNTKIVHCTYRFGKIMWHYHLAALRHCLKHAEHGLAILDRNWISEEIYAHFYRNGTNWPHQGRILQKLLLKHGVITILCLLNRQQAQEQVEKHRKNGYHSPQFVTKPIEISDRYWNLWYGGGPFITPITYTDDVIVSGGLNKQPNCLKYEIVTEGAKLDEFMDNVLELLEYQRATQYPRALEFNNRNIAGHLRTAKWLIVGDRVNHPNFEKCWPFMIHANSTLFIAEAMHRLACREEEFMWTNADCPELHINQIRELKPSIKILALGGKPHATLAAYKIPHETIPHPSYGRRFMGLLPWTAELKAALSL